MLEGATKTSPVFDQVLAAAVAAVAAVAAAAALSQQPRELNLTCTLINTTQKGTNLLFHPHSSVHAEELYTVHTRSKP